MRLTALFIALGLALTGRSQTEFSLYRLNATLPQSNLINPAFYPNSKIVIGLPVISSVYGSVNTDGISFNDIFIDSEDDSLKLDTLNFPDKLKATNRTVFSESIQLFYFGFRGKKSYLSFGIHQVSETRFNYPGDIVGWAIRGPGDSRYAGKPLDLGAFYGRTTAYNKVSINYTRDITSKLRVGARFNYLLGVASAESTEISGKLTVGIDSININTGRMLFQTAGIDFFDQNNLTTKDYVNYFLNTKNKGFAWDLGATYNLTDNLMLSAAVNDLGFISWKDYTRSYSIDPVNYTFKGFDLLDYLNQSPGDEFLSNEADSLENLFNPTESTGGKFKTALVGKFYAGVNYRILRVNNFSALVYLDLFDKKINPAVNVGYNIQLGRLLNATVGLTFQNGKIDNVGAGLSLRLTHLQIYATSDRANSFVYPSNASRADLRTGVNFVFGKVKKKDDDDKKKEKEKEAEPEPEEPKEEPQPEEEKKDSVVVAPDTTQVSEPIIQNQEPEATPPVEDTVIQQVEQEPVVVEQEPVAEEPRHETVKMGNHPEELNEYHYVVVGAFRMRANANRYSRVLREAGYENNFGFVSEKGYYYVTIYRSGDLEETRKVRDQFRQISKFQFQESWVLTVQQ